MTSLFWEIPLLNYSINKAKKSHLLIRKPELQVHWDKNLKIKKTYTKKELFPSLRKKTVILSRNLIKFRLVKLN